MMWSKASSFGKIRLDGGVTIRVTEENLTEVNLTELDPPEDQVAPELPPITVFWRPGCPFCMTLDRSMKKSGLEYDKRNIWEDPEAGEYVRSVADGNEVVPTVRVGSQGLVNPNMGQIMQALREESEQTLTTEQLESLVASGVEPQAGPLGKLLGRILSN